MDNIYMGDRTEVGVVHLEVEAGEAIAVGVQRRGVDQGVELSGGEGHAVGDGDGAAVDQGAAGQAQVRDRGGDQRIRLDVGEGEVRRFTVRR